jgi:hypothetical protein
MAYNEKLAERIRRRLEMFRAVSEIKMFGGLCWTIRGHMCCGLVGEDLMIRVGPEGYPNALKRPGARPMDFTGRPMKGFVFVGPRGCKTDKALFRWITEGATYSMSLRPKV